MWVVVHTVSGMAVGHVLVAHGYPVVLLAALALHLLLDLVPHWDYTRSEHARRWAVADVSASVAVLALASIALGVDAKVIVAGVVSAAPDLDSINALRNSPRRWRVFPSHWRGFPHGACAPVPGVLTQAAVVAASVAVLFLA